MKQRERKREDAVEMEKVKMLWRWKMRRCCGDGKSEDAVEMKNRKCRGDGKEEMLWRCNR